MNKPLPYSKRLILLTAALLIASHGLAQETENLGTAAQLTVSSGKTINVLLQTMADGKVTFKTGSKEMTVPASKISRFEFSMNKEEFEFFTANNVISNEEVSEIFGTPDLGKREKLKRVFKTILENVAEDYNAGNYADVISAIAPFLTERTPYMQVENNLQNTFIMLMESYRGLGDFSMVRKCAAPLLGSDNADLVQKAQVNAALVALAGSDFQTAEKIRQEIDSEAAALYLEACIKRAQGEPKVAIQIITQVISEHGNDIDWMAPSELLSAYLYMDMISTNSPISTNSVRNTARQVKNIYGGSAVAADARKLWVSLGGEALEAADKAQKAEAKRLREKREAELKAKREAEKAKKAAERAAATNNVEATTTEIESE